MAKFFFIFYIKVKALNEKEWDPENWNGDSCLNTDEANHLETTSHSKLPLLKKEVCPLETSLPLLKNSVITSPRKMP